MSDVPPPRPPPGSFGPPPAAPAPPPFPPQPAPQPGYGQPYGQPAYGQPAYGQPAGSGPPYASFGSRLGGFLIDSLIVSLFFIPAIVAIFAGPTEISTCNVDASGDLTFFDDEAVGLALCEGPTGGTIAVAALLGLAGVVGNVYYFARGDGRGQTIGKRALGIRVVDSGTGQPIGTARGFLRYLGRLPSAWAFYLGYLWMLWDDQSQTWQDKIASSYVVKD